jgi:hypothetical protein
MSTPTQKSLGVKTSISLSDDEIILVENFPINKALIEKLKEFFEHQDPADTRQDLMALVADYFWLTIRAAEAAPFTNPNDPLPFRIRELADIITVYSRIPKPLQL